MIESQITQNPKERARWHSTLKQDYIKQIDKTVQSAAGKRDIQSYYEAKDKIQSLQYEFNKKVLQMDNVDMFEHGVQKLISARRRVELYLPPVDFAIYPILQLGDKRGPGVYNYKDLKIKIVVTNLGNHRIAIDTDLDKELPGGDAYVWQFDMESADPTGKQPRKIYYEIEHNYPLERNMFFLEPGGNTTRELRLSRQYDVKSAGKYNVRLTYNSNAGRHLPHGIYPSNQIEIEIFGGF